MLVIFTGTLQTVSGFQVTTLIAYQQPAPQPVPQLPSENLSTTDENLSTTDQMYTY